MDLKVRCPMADGSRWPKFPEPLRAPFDDVWADVASVHFKWRLYRDLFQKENYPIMNGTTPAVFSLIEESLRADMTMSISRLLDRAKVAGRDTMSVERLLADVEPHCPRAVM